MLTFKFFGTAGWLLYLAVFLMGCSMHSYRLSGHSTTQEVALLDSLAVAVVDSIHQDFDRTLVLLAKAESTALDSMAKSATALSPTIQKSQRDYQALRNKYKTVFQQMQKFRSFGGNSVFSDDDVSVSTDKLLKEIAGRFYKGRAFSLETEANIRDFIKRELAPLEDQISRQRRRVNQLKRSQAGKSDAKEEIAIEFAKKRKDLVDDTNLEILSKLSARSILKTTVKTDGTFMFQNVVAGKYYLHGGVSDSLGYIVPLDVRAHTFQELKQGAGENILIASIDKRAENE